MKHISFLSFGHWTPSPQSQTRSAEKTWVAGTSPAMTGLERRL